MGAFIAAYLTHTARVIFAAGVMLAIGGALWLALGVLTALADIQTGSVVLTSMVLIALAGIAGGSFVSVRHITPNSILHPVIAAEVLAVLFVSITMDGDVGPMRLLVFLGAGVTAAMAAFIAGRTRKRSE